MPRSAATKRDADNTAAAVRSANVREISGGWPSFGDEARRESCRLDLRRFLETYFPRKFSLAWSPSHLATIAAAQRVILGGGLFAAALPRGTGKTTIFQCASLWALLYRHRRFVVVIGATQSLAERILKSARRDLESNDLLLSDFPEVCYPVQRLGGDARRALGQLFDGSPTGIELKRDELVFPGLPERCYPGVCQAYSRLLAFGLTGAVRGPKVTLPTGEEIRPDLVLMDDPQTRESAASSIQTETRMATLRGDVLGLAGPETVIAGLAAVTVIYADDLADQLTDRKRCPEWQGQRYSAVVSWPKRRDLWDTYTELRNHGLRELDGDCTAAEQYYRDNRAAMDDGAVVSWPERHPGADTAIQFCFHELAKLREDGFASEFQNEPLRDEGGKSAAITVADAITKLSGLDRGVVPLRAEHVTAFIDVHDEILYYSAAAWQSDYSGSVIDYGTYPKQGIARFYQTAPRKSMASLSPGAGREGTILAGLTMLVGELSGREYTREDGTPVRIDRILIDSGYVSELVRTFCRRSEHAAILQPSQGRGLKATSRPMSEYKPRPGDRRGWHWLLTSPSDRLGRLLRPDTNFWKSFVRDRVRTPVGGKASLTFPGKDCEALRFFCEHMAGERPKAATSDGRTVEEWDPLPGAEVHWFDCVVGCAVGASLLGVTLLDSSGVTQRRSKRVRLSERTGRTFGR